MKDSPQDPGCCWREPGLSHTTGIAGYSLPTLLPPRERVPPLGPSAWCGAPLGAGDARKAALTILSAVTKLGCCVLFLLFLEWVAGISPQDGWASANSVSCTKTCPGQHAPADFVSCFPITARVGFGQVHWPPPGSAIYTESVCLLLGAQVGGPPGSCNSHKGAFVDGCLFCCFEMGIKRGLFYAAMTLPSLPRP